MTGDLTNDCLPDILRRLYRNRASGELKFTQGGMRKSIFFELGAIVFASSNSKHDRIGESMMRNGMLSQEDFDRASAAMTRGKRFGRILVELDIISERDLTMYVTFQILDIIYSLFEWTVGTYEFVPQEKAVPEDLRLELSTATIILEGVRRIKDFSVVQRGLGDLNRLIGPTSDPLLRLQTLSLKPLDRQLVEAIRQPMNLLQALMMVKSQPDTVLRALYGLLSAGVLERLGAPELNRQTGKLEIPKQLFEQAALAQPIVPPKEAKAAQRTGEVKVAEMLAQLQARLERNDPFEILGVTRDATREQIRDAYYALAKDFHPDRHLHAPREVRQEVERIFARLTTSYEAIKEHSPTGPLPSATPTIASGGGSAYANPPMAQLSAAQKTQRAEQLFLEARNRFLSKDYNNAVYMLKEAVRLDANQARFFQLLGNVMAAQQKNLKEAETYLRRAIELDPFSPMAHASLGQLYVKANMPKQAETEFREALKLDPTHQVSLRGLEAIKPSNEGGGFLNKLFKK